MCVSSTVTVRRSGVFTCMNNDGMSVPDPDTLSGPTSLIWMLLLLGDFLTYDSCSSLNAPTWTLSKFPNTSLINLMWMREVCTQELLLYSNTVLCSSQDFKNYCVVLHHPFRIWRKLSMDLCHHIWTTLVLCFISERWLFSS